MDGALRHTDEVAHSGLLAFLRHPHVPWGLVVTVELLGLAFLSAWLVLSVIPDAFGVEWGCMTSTGEMRTAADTYVATFAVTGALGWLVVAGATSLAYATGRRAYSLILPVAWFSLVVLVGLVVAAAIGPLPC